MGLVDRLKDAVSGDDGSDGPAGPAASGPAAASGATGGARMAGRPDSGDNEPTGDPEPDRQVSEGASGFGSAETSLGGADAVPDTPDGVAEDYT